MLRFPAELLECIIEEIDSCADLFALALTCSTLSHAIIPTRLSYHSIEVSISNTFFLENLKQRPDLAAHVRYLAVMNTPAAIPCRVPYGTRIPAADYNGNIELAANLLDNLKSTLSHLPRLRGLSLQGGHRGSFRLKMDTVEEVLREHKGQLDEITLDITRFTWDSSFNIVSGMRNLRTLELLVSGIRLTQWNNLCEFLAHYPGLQVLTLPSIIQSPDRAPAHCSPLPYLPVLRQFSSPVDTCHDSIMNHIFDFVFEHKTITDLRWMTFQVPPEDRMPSLPNIRRFCLGTGSAGFVRQFLSVKAPGSIRLDSFECFRIDGHPFSLLRALDPSALRVLHVHDLGSEGLNGIRTLAQ